MSQRYVNETPVVDYRRGSCSDNPLAAFCFACNERSRCSLSVFTRSAASPLGAFVGISNHPDVMLKVMLMPGDFQFINKPHDSARPSPF